MKGTTKIALAGVMIAVMVFASSGVMAYISPGNPDTVTTSADITSSGSPPVIEYVWVLPDEDDTVSGTQVNIVPSDERNDIYACVVVSDPQGRGDIRDVWIDVYHPTTIPYKDRGDAPAPGSFKYQQYGEWLDPDNTEDAEFIEECKLDALNAGLIDFSDWEEINYQIFDQPGWYMYKVELPMNYHQPAGEYEARTFATDKSGEISASVSTYFDWLPATYLEIDFSTLDWEIITPSVWAWIQGDYDLSTPSAPTVKNEGNTELYIYLNATPLVGATHHKEITDFDVQFRGVHEFFSAGEKHRIGEDQSPSEKWVLQLCHTEKIDFSLHAPEGRPADSYSGEMTIYAESAWD